METIAAYLWGGLVWCATLSWRHGELLGHRFELISVHRQQSLRWWTFFHPLLLNTKVKTYNARTMVLAVGPGNPPAILGMEYTQRAQGACHSLQIQHFPGPSVHRKHAFVCFWEIIHVIIFNILHFLLSNKSLLKTIAIDNTLAVFWKEGPWWGEIISAISFVDDNFSLRSIKISHYTSIPLARHILTAA